MDTFLFYVLLIYCLLPYITNNIIYLCTTLISICYNLFEKRRKLSWTSLTLYDYISQILNTILF